MKKNKVEIRKNREILGQQNKRNPFYKNWRSLMGAIKYKHNSLLKVLNNEKYNQKHLKRKPRSISGKILGSITMPHPEAQANSAMARGRLSSTFTCNVLEILPGSTTVRVTLTDAVSPGSNSPAEGSNSHFICCFSSWKNKLKL